MATSCDVIAHASVTGALWVTERGVRQGWSCSLTSHLSPNRREKCLIPYQSRYLYHTEGRLDVFNGIIIKVNVYINKDYITKVISYVVFDITTSK